MPDIHFPTNDGSRNALLDRLYEKLRPLAPADRPVSQEQFDALVDARTQWAPLMGGAKLAARAQGQAVGALAPARDHAGMLVSHYVQVFNLAVRRGTYAPADRALFGLPTAVAEVPSLTTDAELSTWLANIASGDAALTAAGQPAMANPSAADVARAGASFATQLAARSSTATAKVEASTQAEPLRDAVDELLADLYAEIKHRHRKLAPAQARDMARAYGFRFTNHRGEQPEGHYEGAVGAGQLLEVYEGHFPADLHLTLRNPGLTSWEIGLAPTATAQPPQPMRVTAGSEVRLALADLGNLAHTFLVLHNLSSDQQGSWEVTFGAGK